MPGQASAALVFKLDTAGHYYWNQGYINNNYVDYLGMAGDNAGNSYLYGESQQGVNDNGFLSRVDSSGKPVWTEQYDYQNYQGYINTFTNGIVDNEGNILVMRHELRFGWQ